jgi:hypothetical protein
MDIRSLISKLENIDSLNRAPVVEADDPEAVIAKYTDHPELPAYIDSKDGKVKYMDNNMDTGQKSPKVMPTDWIERYAPDLAAALKAQGGNQQGYGAQQKGGLFGIKGLGNFDQGTTVNTKQAGADASSKKYKADKLKQLSDLVAKLNAEGGGNTDPTVGKVDYSLGGGSAPGMKLKESILREFGYEVDEGGITLGADGKVDPNGHTPEKQMALNKMVGDNMNAAAGKDAIIKQIQAIMAELGQPEEAYASDPDVIKALGIAQKAIDAASKKPDVAKPTDDKSKGMAAKIARLKELIRKQPGLAQAPAGTGADTRMTGPATTESILAKLRALEESFLAEDDRAEVDQLWSEIQKGLEDGTVSGDMAKEVDTLGAEVNKYQQANPSKDAKPVTTTPDAKKPAGGGAGRKNPGTMAFQNWLNSKGKKVAVDGMYGDETQTAAHDPAIRKDPAFIDMIGVGTAYNVKPGQGPGTMSLGDPGWLAAMKKHGYDPKTGNPIAGSTATKPSTATPGAAGGSAAIPADANRKEPYWVNGTRYEATPRGGWEVTATPQDALQWNSTRARSMAKYTGPDSAYGKTDAGAPTGTTAAKPAAPQTGAEAVAAQRAKMGMSPQRPVTPPTDAQMAKMKESVVGEDNAILAMIRGIKV